MIVLCILVVNENVQMIDMWLATVETTLLDNALITMEHLYRTGSMNICLQRLMNESSEYNIEYFIDRNADSAEKIEYMTINDNDFDEQNEHESLHKSRGKFMFKLSMSDIEDHKRQLTFCNVDLISSQNYRAILLEEQLKLFSIIEQIFRVLLKLEMAGHPHYQVKKERFDIYDTHGTAIDFYSLFSLYEYPPINFLL